MSISETNMTELFEKFNYEESLDLRMFNRIFREKNDLDFDDYDEDDLND